VAGQKGTVNALDSMGGTNESIYSALPAAGQNSVEVPLITLDDLVQAQFGTEENRFIDVCKMDIERAEYEVFQSQTSSTIRRFRHFIVEIHPHESLRETDLIEKICSFGFERVPDEQKQVPGVYLFKNVEIRG
jgi:hypothetical protein